MEIVVLVLAALAALVLAAPRLRRVQPLLRELRRLLAQLGREQGPADLAQLIQALFNSLLNPRQRTLYQRRHVVTTNRMAVVAHPADAAVLGPVLPVVQDDLNAALEDRARRDRLVVDLPIALLRVEADPSVPQGQPRLIDAGASAGGPAADATYPGPPPPPPPPSPPRASSHPRASARPRRANPPTPADDPEQAALLGLWPLASAETRRTIAIPPEGITLGRDPALGPGFVDVETVSWRHARIVPGADGWRLVDLDATNGTYVGEQRVRDARIEQDDVIGLGRKVKLRFLAGATFGATQLAGQDEAAS